MFKPSHRTTTTLWPCKMVFATVAARRPIKWPRPSMIIGWARKPTGCAYGRDKQDLFDSTKSTERERITAFLRPSAVLGILRLSWWNKISRKEFVLKSQMRIPQERESPSWTASVHHDTRSDDQCKNSVAIPDKIYFIEFPTLWVKRAKKAIRKQVEEEKNTMSCISLLSFRPNRIVLRWTHDCFFLRHH